MIYSCFKDICISGIAASVPEGVVEINSLKETEDPVMIDNFIKKKSSFVTNFRTVFKEMIKNFVFRWHNVRKQIEFSHKFIFPSKLFHIKYTMNKLFYNLIITFSLQKFYK